MKQPFLILALLAMMLPCRAQAPTSAAEDWNALTGQKLPPASGEAILQLHNFEKNIPLPKEESLKGDHKHRIYNLTAIFKDSGIPLEKEDYVLLHYPSRTLAVATSVTKQYSVARLLRPDVD
jgi:hypothetical protein